MDHRRQNLGLVGTGRHGKMSTWLRARRRRVPGRAQVRYFSRRHPERANPLLAWPINRVGRVIDTLLRNDLT